MPYTPKNEEMDEFQVTEDISRDITRIMEGPSTEEPTPVQPQQPRPAQQPPLQARPAAPRTAPAKPKPKTKTAHAAPQKRRPKRKKTYNLLGLPQLLSTIVWLALIVFIGTTLGRFMWVCAADVLAFGRENKEVVVSITEDDNMDTIIEKLQTQGLIRYPWLFQLYADLSGAEEDIELGTFTLNTNYDYHALVNELSSSASKVEVVVQIPEGYNCRQIFALLEEKGVASAASLEEYAANGDLPDYWFLEDLERGEKYCLEGFLFPDTYNFYQGGGAEHAIKKLLSGFNNKFTLEMQDALNALNTRLAAVMRSNGKSDEYVVENMLSVQEVVIVASLIEKESASGAESPNIASVIYNRLYDWGSTPRYLNIDAAIVYVTGNHTNIDTSFDSPYNTYLNTGLTPTPIANPGLSSLEAALKPADTNYFYYVLNPAAGAHVFASSLDEHNANIAKYSGG